MGQRGRHGACTCCALRAASVLWTHTRGHGWDGAVVARLGVRWLFGHASGPAWLTSSMVPTGLASWRACAGAARTYSDVKRPLSATLKAAAATATAIIHTLGTLGGGGSFCATGLSYFPLWTGELASGPRAALRAYVAGHQSCFRAQIVWSCAQPSCCSRDLIMIPQGTKRRGSTASTWVAQPRRRRARSGPTGCNIIESVWQRWRP